MTGHITYCHGDEKKVFSDFMDYGSSSGSVTLCSSEVKFSLILDPYVLTNVYVK